MSHVIELEAIGSSKPWVARITGTDPKFGLAREFVNGARDYSRANKPKTRGVYTTFTLGDGVYEINDPQSWGRTERYFVRIAEGDAVRIDAAAALAAVQAAVAPTDEFSAAAEKMLG